VLARPLRDGSQVLGRALCARIYGRAAFANEARISCTIGAGGVILYFNGPAMDIFDSTFSLPPQSGRIAGRDLPAQRHALPVDPQVVASGDSPRLPGA
jgi:4-hydroxyphenylpyruvate dioxygenase-like putative hemolysin